MRNPAYEDTIRSSTNVVDATTESDNVDTTAASKHETSSHTRAHQHQLYNSKRNVTATAASGGVCNPLAPVYDRCSGPAHNRQDVAEEDTYDHLQVRNFQLHGGRTYSSSGVLPPADTCTDLTNQDDTYSHLVKPIGSHAPPVMISATAAVETQAGTDEPVYSLITEAVKDSHSQPANSLLATQQPSIRGITLTTNQGDAYSQPADSLLVDQHLGTAGAISSISQSDTYIEPADLLLGDKQLSTRRVRTSCLRRCVQANTAAGSKSSLHDTSKKESSTFRQLPKDMAITSTLASSTPKSSHAKENGIHCVDSSADVIIYNQLLDQSDDSTTTADGMYCLAGKPHDTTADEIPETPARATQGFDIAPPSLAAGNHSQG